MAAELARSNRDLEQFASAASHDLQEPLRIVQGFLTILRDKYGPALDDQARKYIQTTLDAAGRMSALIRAILASVADIAVMPLQDVLGIGSEGRMNVPGRPSGNWSWRFRAPPITCSAATGSGRTRPRRRTPPPTCPRTSSRSSTRTSSTSWRARRSSSRTWS